MTSSNVGASVDPLIRRLPDGDRSPDVSAEPVQRRSLTRLAMTGTAWTIFGFGAGEAMRLGGHLVYAWVLGPEALGIMVMVNVVIHGLKMFSDVGTGPAIIQHPRGDDSDFLNTAWTLQVIRHVCLFLCACALAYPVAMYRGNMLLASLLPVAAVSTLCHGFISTAPSTLHRRLELGRLTLAYDINVRFVTVLGTVMLALVLKNVWALALGGVAGALYAVFVTHALIRDYGNRLKWDRAAVGDLVRFGRWIFIATAMTFLCSHGDKLVLGGFVSDAQLGMYGAAFYLAMGIPNALRAVTNRVLFPVFSHIREQSVDQVRRKIARARTMLQLLAMPVLCAVAIGAESLVALIYPDDMIGVAWMLQLLAIGGLFRVIELTMSPVLLANGDSFRHMLVLISQSLLLIASMIVGGLLGGYFGLVLGVAMSPLLNYPVLAWAVSRYGVWMPTRDLGFLLGSALVISAGIMLLSQI
jgi:O-antigen/teichoic acid export membrane protein